MHGWRGGAENLTNLVNLRLQISYGFSARYLLIGPVRPESSIDLCQRLNITNGAGSMRRIPLSAVGS
jgi:hypothetical protein